jgi:hypothetical protein
MDLYLTALGLTIAVEYVVYVLFFRERFIMIFIYAVVINCFTHPIAYFLYGWFIRPSININTINIYFLIVEIVVFLAETLLIMLLFKTNLRRSLAISFVSNLATALLSFVI